MDRFVINPARIDFVTLRLFCLVAQSKSITKGAAQCNLAVSAASRRLAELEATTGSVLLERSAQGVQLTPAGHMAMQHAMRLCHGFELFGAELSDFSHGYRGHVRLWANMSALTECLPEALSTFMERRPDIKVEIEEQLSGDTVRALVDGYADIGILAEGTPAHGLEVAPFHVDELVVICPASHELACHEEVPFSACLAYPFVGLNRGSSLLELITRTALDHGTTLQLRVQVRSFGAMCRMVGARLGVGVIPRAACEPLQASYGIKALSLTDAWARRNLLIAHNPDYPFSAAAELLWKHLGGTQ
ncbi:LysR family transcriptional regulator [Cupriavidus necator]|uniref:LysR family transcriptional regulator n=1 Tax=Cupriavidus necator TaxID=106590 RepID=UPI0039C2C38C